MGQKPHTRERNEIMQRSHSLTAVQFCYPAELSLTLNKIKHFSKVSMRGISDRFVQFDFGRLPTRNAGSAPLRSNVLYTQNRTQHDCHTSYVSCWMTRTVKQNQAGRGWGVRLSLSKAKRCREPQRPSLSPQIPRKWQGRPPEHPKLFL